ncbi:MAG: RDD family protein, partial [Clostridia bacterium]|nr:RDD family protein [Clostridia bacterium]
MQLDNKESIFRKRLLAVGIDIAILVLVFMIANIIPIYDDYIMIARDFGRSYYIVYGIILLIIEIGFLCKDVIGGQSIGKKIVHIKVVNADESKANLLQLIIRNITILIWPIEMIILLLGKRKIGDVISKTMIVCR